MKSLKLEHQLAELVKAGEKTSTWRIGDEKDLQAGDVIELIDKFDPNDQATWQVFAMAKITKVYEKPLGLIGPDDMNGHEDYTSEEQMLETYQKYYGPNVHLGTLVKIIQFELVEPSQA